MTKKLIKPVSVQSAFFLAAFFVLSGCSSQEESNRTGAGEEWPVYLGDP